MRPLDSLLMVTKAVTHWLEECYLVRTRVIFSSIAHCSFDIFRFTQRVVHLMQSGLCKCSVLFAATPLSNEFHSNIISINCTTCPFVCIMRCFIGDVLILFVCQQKSDASGRHACFIRHPLTVLAAFPFLE